MTEDLLKYCRYYKGENKQPDVSDLFWLVEWRWVTGKKKNPELKDSDWYVMKDYINAGLENFAKDDGVPIVIKALLYEYFQRGGDLEDKSFSRFYAFYKNGKTK